LLSKRIGLLVNAGKKPGVSDLLNVLSECRKLRFFFLDELTNDPNAVIDVLILLR
jgi:hypothetical protein